MSLEFDISADLSKLQKGLSKAQGDLDRFAKNGSKKLERFSKSATQAGKNLSIGITAPLALAGGAALKFASDAEETGSKFNTVFSGVAEQAQKSANTLRNSFGLSTQASQDLLASTGDLLTGFGFAQDTALDLSTQVNQLAVDLASFTNFSGGAEGASQALTKALLGERESVKSLGISILEADVKAKVLENTQKGLTFESNRQAKAFATLQIAQEQSKNAIGDYERTSESFANQSRLLKARLSDLGVEFGKVLLPLATKIASKIAGLADAFSNLSPQTKKIIVIVAGLAAAAGPLLVALGAIGAALPAIAAGFAAITGPIGLIVAGISALGVVVYKNWDTIKKFAIDVANQFIELYNQSALVRAGFEAFMLQLKNTFAVAKFVAKSIATVFTTAFDIIGEKLTGIGQLLKGALTGNLDGIEAGLKKLGSSITENLTGAFSEIAENGSELFDTLEKNGKKAIDNILNPETKNKLVFESSEESKKKLEDDVAESVAKGVDKGLKGGQGRAQIQSVTAGTGLESQGANPLSEITGSGIDTSQVDSQFEAVSEKLRRFGENARDIIENNIGSAFAGLGKVIGNALSGSSNIIQQLGQVMLSSLGNIMVQLGKQAITLGVSMLKIKAAIKGLGGVGAIAAGTALVAVGSAFANKASQIGDQMGNNSGNIGGGGQNSGGRQTAITSSNFQSSEVVFKIKGRDLVGVLDRNSDVAQVIG